MAEGEKRTEGGTVDQNAASLVLDRANQPNFLGVFVGKFE
jgi:hypothetical protein